MFTVSDGWPLKGGVRDGETNAEVTALQRFRRSLLDTEQEYQELRTLLRVHSNVVVQRLRL